MSAVSPKAQTTWRRVAGIRTGEEAQIIFFDAPGLLSPRDLIQRAMRREAEETVKEADCVLLVVDPTQSVSPEERDSMADLLQAAGVPVVAVVNKLDAAEEGQVAREEEWLAEAFPGAEVVRVSATIGEGLDELLGRLERRIPPGPFLYPADDMAIEPVRFFVGELLRETVFELYRDEIPYSTACRVEEYREGGERTYIQANLFVERPSQKGIVIGEGGRAIRALGKRAREKIEAFLGEAVYLDLWVKVLPSWRRRKEQLRRFGFHVPDDEGS